MSEQVRSADVYISANEHGAKIQPVDLIVAMDECYGNTGLSMQAYLRKFSDAPIASPYEWADHRITKWPGNPRRILSGMAAVWLASEMGASHIYIAGMDGYDGTPGAVKDAQLVAAVVTCPVTVSGPLETYF